MSVYNGADTLPETLRSVLDQEGCDFEFVVVDDGSTDGSGDILDEWEARERRLRVIHQENTGLTRALILGCAAARGELIARQDAGDESLPGRLARQASLLKSNPQFVAVSCYTQMVGPRGEILYTAEITQGSLNDSLRTSDPYRLGGPPGHGSVMMRRHAYIEVGGYRPHFYFAQDLDLWTRLAERGEFGVVPQPLFKVRREPSSISGMQAPEQRLLKDLIAKATTARRLGEDEARWLAQAANVRKVSDDRAMRRVAAGNYFIGSCLRARDPKAAASYFRSAVEHDVRHWRAWARFLECTIRGRLGRQAVGSASTGDA